MLLTRTAIDAADVTATALLNCLVREVCAAEHQVRPDGPHLVVRLPRAGVALRARLLRPPVGFTYRLATPVEELRKSVAQRPLPGGGRGLRDGWIPVDWQRLADLVAGELELATGVANPEFLGQVRDSHAALRAIIAARSAVPPAAAGYVPSEQALVAGHRFHPTPKTRQGRPAEWLRYAPEVRARFPLRWLAVRAELVAGEGPFAALEALGPAAPAGHRLLPVHPWQLSLLASRPVLRQAIAEGAVLDLGSAGPEVVPTSSVRTVYLPDADLFCKFSLDVRITNCVRKNAWYELAGAVTLNRLLQPVFADLAEHFNGCRLLAEPAYRSVHLADRRLHEGLGVILRSGLGRTPGTPLLAAALADPQTLGELGATTPQAALAWWSAYVRHVAPPVLHAFLSYGVVLEPHLQNVLVTVAEDGTPTQAIFRDLEGTKLVAGHWELGPVPARVREALTYDAERGWNRVLYCLIVNHLAEIAAAVADLHPELEPELWAVARQCIEAYGRDHGEGPRLRALLAGVPLPAKANLRARWSRSADRSATYIPVPNPLRSAR